MKIRQLYFATIVLVLVACGGGSSSGLPPVRPISPVTGNAVAAEIQNAQVTVYVLDRTGKGAILGSTVTDAQGFYSLDLQTQSQPVLIEVSGGQYVEEASGIRVELADGQVLRAVARYQSGQPMAVMVTPLTQLAAGLAQYRIATGVTPETAVDSALADVSTLLGVQVDKVLPHNITDSTSTTTVLTPPYTYGFLLAAISSFTQQISQLNSVPSHTVYTSVTLAQNMYNDIVSDGLLDGRGRNKTGDAMMDLAMGIKTLNQDVYRLALAQHLLAISASPQNKTGLGQTALHSLAHTLSTSADVLFGAAPPIDTADYAPVIKPALAENSAFNSIYNFQVAITSLIGAASVSFEIDGVPIGNAIDPTHPAILINTPAYTTGTHTIGVSATDVLGLSSHQEFTYRFGKVFVNVISAAATNTTPFTLTGNYDDQGAGFKSLTVQGKPVTPNADKTWSAQVNLTLGRNHIPVIFEAASDISDNLDVIVDYDTGPPSIDTSARHGTACFSNYDGTCTEFVLANDNLTAPLSIKTDHTELAGVAETRLALTDNNIPFFAFIVSDPPSDGVNTRAENLKVRFQYVKNSSVIVPWSNLTPVDNEYHLPLVTEVLSTAWLRSAPSDIHTLSVEVVDEAGNISTIQFSFMIEFVVAPFSIDSVIDTGDTTFTSVSFDARGSLYGNTVTVVEYAFTNTTGKAFNISPSDDSVHSVENLIDRLVRENVVRLQTSTEWRAGFVENLLSGSVCPSMPLDAELNPKWTPVTELLNYVGGGVWYPVRVPDPSLGTVESVLTDTPTAPLASSWTQLADIDGTYNSSVISLGDGRTLSYSYDYVFDTGHLDQPAAVRNWTVTLDGDVTTCPDVMFLQQRQVFSYASEPGYPKNTLSAVFDGAFFVTSSFTVFDDTTKLPIEAMAGWYFIPAGHMVLVRKQVTLPILNIYNDTDVADTTTFSSYTPHQFDHTLTWTINRAMKLNVAHDGGADNLLFMSTREVSAGVGTTTYQLSR